MSRQKGDGKVISMKRRQSVALGALLVIFSVYLIVIFIMTLTKEHLSIYEVTETQIADDETIRGMVLRDEQLVKTDGSGYVNYYVGEGARVGLRTNVYSLDRTGDIAQKLSTMDTGNVTLSDTDNQEIRDSISNFREDFTLSDYNKITNFRYDLDNTVLQLSTVNLSERLNQLMKSEGRDSAGFEIIKAKKSGVISFCADGLEGIEYDKMKREYFENATDHWEQLRPSEEVSANTSVYKLIASEKWSIVLPLSAEQYEKVKGETQLTVTLRKDNLQLTAPVTTYTCQGDWYAKLDFDKYMIRYLENRYLDVHIEFNHAEGLKIPVTSIVKKKCYVFPKAYLTEGSVEGGGGTGVFVRKFAKDGTASPQFQKTEVYYIDDNGMVYIDSDLFEPGTVIIMVGDANGASLELTDIRELEGVYNCNQGYCRFQIIDKLYENEEYTIVKNNTIYGLATYDHIILNPELIKSNEIIY